MGRTKLYADEVYHIYNQGNNRQAIFFSEENYRYFIRRIKKYLLPYAELLCYCLMPNHFHWLVYSGKYTENIKDSSEAVLAKDLSRSIGVLLSGYTKAINNQEKRSGSLFRQGVKYNNGMVDGVITIDGPEGREILLPNNNFARTCFDYIHNNPVKAGLVRNSFDWPFSSARDFQTDDPDSICNLDLARKIVY